MGPGRRCASRMGRPHAPATTPCRPPPPAPALSAACCVSHVCYSVKVYTACSREHLCLKPALVPVLRGSSGERGRDHVQACSRPGLRSRLEQHMAGSVNRCEHGCAGCEEDALPRTDIAPCDSMVGSRLAPLGPRARAAQAHAATGAVRHGRLLRDRPQPARAGGRAGQRARVCQRRVPGPALAGQQPRRARLQRRLHKRAAPCAAACTACIETANGLPSLASLSDIRARAC